LAARQHGVVSIAQLERLGVSADAARWRARTGQLHRVHRGVYAVGHPAIGTMGRCMAAVLAVGGRNGGRGGSPLEHWGAAVSHRSAAFVWDLLLLEESLIDVALPNDSGRATRFGLRVHRPRSLPDRDVTLRSGIPVTTPRRTVADLRRALAWRSPAAVSGRELRRAIRQANVIGLDLSEEDRGDRTRSDLEAAVLGIFKRHRAKLPEINVRVGPYLVDFLWRAEKVVVEVDSYLYHRGREAFVADRRRDLGLRRLGHEVIRISELQVEEEPDSVAEGVLEVLRHRRP
jgi:very-short-patch-repair endonuclease